MGYIDLEAAYKTDTQLITSRVRATVKQAMNPDNHVLMLTTMKLDFSEGQLLVGEDPRFIYRSPEVKIETIPLCAVEAVFNTTTTTTTASSVQRRQKAGADVYERSSAVSRNQVSLLKEYAPFLKAITRELPSVVPRAIIHEFFEGQIADVKEVKLPNPPVEEVGHMTATDIMKWIEDGEILRQKELPPEPVENPLLVQTASTTSVASSVDTNPAIRETELTQLVAQPVKSDDTLKSVASIATVAESTQTENPKDIAPFHDGPIGSVEEYPAGKGCIAKIIQCGHPNIRPGGKIL